MTTLQEASTKALDALRKAMQGNLDFDVALEAFEALRTALAQQGEQQPVCHGCGIPAGDVHMSTCKSGKWPSRVSNGDTAAPEPQAQEPTAWRTEALKWIRRKAEDQRATNEQNPRHAEAYPSWGERVRNWHWLADELELEQNSTSFGLEPYQEPAPQPAQGGQHE